MQNKYFTTAEAASILKVTRFTVLNWVKQKNLDAITTVGGHKRIPETSIRELLRKPQAIQHKDTPELTKESAKEPVMRCKSYYNADRRSIAYGCRRHFA